MNPAFKARMHSYLCAELHKAKREVRSVRGGYYPDDEYEMAIREARGVEDYLTAQVRKYTLTPIELKSLQEKNLRKRKKG